MELVLSEMGKLRLSEVIWGGWELLRRTESVEGDQVFCTSMLTWGASLLLKCSLPAELVTACLKDLHLLTSSSFISSFTLGEHSCYLQHLRLSEH